MVALAVNVTEVPAHMVEADAVMETEGVTVVFTATVIPFEVTVVGLAHAKLEVISQVTTAPLVSVVVVNVAELVPALVPFTFH